MDGEEVRRPAVDRASLRERAEQARRRARALAAQTLVHHADAERRLRDAAALTAAAQQLCDRLRETVGRHARLCRAQHEPPEQTVLSIKQATTEAIAIARTKVDTIDPVEVQFLREQLVRWSVEAYFDKRML